MASPTHAHPTALAAHGPKAAFLRRAGELFLETLREIFDENAYRRFLERRGMAPSRAAYSEFLDEMRQRRERRVKCC